MINKLISNNPKNKVLVKQKVTISIRVNDLSDIKEASLEVDEVDNSNTHLENKNLIVREEQKLNNSNIPFYLSPLKQYS